MNNLIQIILLSFFLFSFVFSPLVVQSNFSSKKQSLTSSLDFEDSLNDVVSKGWIFANQDHWSISSSYSISGLHSLQQTFNDNSVGDFFDSVQYQNQEFSNGSISAWVFVKADGYFGHNLKAPTLWLRSDQQLSDGSSCYFGNAPSTICNGYRLVFYHEILSLELAKDGESIHLGTYQMNEDTKNQWYHIKFEAIGTTLKAWVSTCSNFSSDPQIGIVNETTFSYGYAGFSSRTQFSINYWYEYIDLVELNIGPVQLASTTDPFCVVSTSPTSAISLLPGLAKTNYITISSPVSPLKSFSSSFLFIIIGLFILFFLVGVYVKYKRQNEQNVFFIRRNLNTQNLSGNYSSNESFIGKNLCPNCHAKNEIGDIFCSQCGSRL
ncbi:MAG: zinc ribbon domain-containing protein [Candidatus Thorarchaeota archaeon]